VCFVKFPFPVFFLLLLRRDCIRQMEIPLPTEWLSLGIAAEARSRRLARRDQPHHTEPRFCSERAGRSAPGTGVWPLPRGMPRTGRWARKRRCDRRTICTQWERDLHRGRKFGRGCGTGAQAAGINKCWLGEWAFGLDSKPPVTTPPASETPT